MKICSRCFITKEKTLFYRATRLKDGRQAFCIECSSIEAKKHRSSPEGKKYAAIYRKSEKAIKSTKASQKKYRETAAHKIKDCARSSKYRASKLNATPKWLTKYQIELMQMYYQLANYLTTMTGIPHHVDHIIPLQGKNSHGLHVPWNLRVIPFNENIRKGNKV